MVELTTRGCPELWKKMPGYGRVQKTALGLWCRVEFLMVSQPVSLSLT